MKRRLQFLRPTWMLTAAMIAGGATTAMTPLYAALGDQKIVKDYTAAAGWTLIVPLNVDGNGLTDYLSYNATTGRAIVSIGIGEAGEQQVVKDYIAAVGWTAIVPINVDGTAPDDLLSYNAATGRAVVSVGVGRAGEQRIVKDYVAAPGWTSIVPSNVDGQGVDDLLSYNATTGRAIVSIGVGTGGEQKVVKDYVAAPGWTSIVAMNVDHDFPGLTDYLSYNAATGQTVVSIGIGTTGDQRIVKQYTAAAGWTSIVPINVDCDPAGLTDYLSYNGTTGRAVVSVGVGLAGDQKIVKEYTAAKGWTAILPMFVNDQDTATDLLSYSRWTGRAIVSVAEPCDAGPR